MINMDSFTPTSGYSQNKNEDDKLQEETAGKKKSLVSWQRKTAFQIKNTDYPPTKWVVPGIIPEGLTLLSGSPKVGKSWLAMQLATAVSNGGSMMGNILVEKNEVLYLALEDGEPRIKNRLIKQGEQLKEDNCFVETATSWKGGILALMEYLKEYPKTGLVIIDTLFKFCPFDDTNKYSDTYKPVAIIQEIATKYRVPIVLIHHTRKGSNSNNSKAWADETMGSQGLTGAVDTIIILQKRDGTNEGTLRIKGRDVEEGCYSLVFDTDICTWSITGKGAKPTLTKEQQRIVDLLESDVRDWTPEKIAEEIGTKSNTISGHLKKLLEAGRIEKPKFGKWRAKSGFGDSASLKKTESPNVEGSIETPPSLPVPSQLTEAEMEAWMFG